MEDGFIERREWETRRKVQSGFSRAKEWMSSPCLSSFILIYLSQLFSSAVISSKFDKWVEVRKTCFISTGQECSPMRRERPNRSTTIISLNLQGGIRAQKIQAADTNIPERTRCFCHSWNNTHKGHCLLLSKTTASKLSICTTTLTDFSVLLFLFSVYLNTE